MPTIVTKGNEIIVSSNPKGHFVEAIISGTPKPGTCMELVTGTDADANGHHTYRAVQSGTTDCIARPTAILTMQLQSERGKTRDDAMVSGDLEMIYFPAAGEEFNMLLRDLGATATLGQSQVGDRLGIDIASGMLIPVNTATPAQTGAYAPFDLLVRLGTDNSANFHAWVRYRGDSAGGAAP